MSGHSYSTTCPICEEEMDCYSDHKPFDTVNSQRINCGFCSYTKIEQRPLTEVNELRKEYNENMEPEEPLKPLTKKDLAKWAKDIKNI